MIPFHECCTALNQAEGGHFLNNRKHPGRQLQRRSKVAERLRRELEAVGEIVRFEESGSADLETCEECERLLAGVIAAMRKTRALLSERTRALEAGLIDDLDFLETDTELDQASAERQTARDLYVQHRQERHGSKAN